LTRREALAGAALRLAGSSETPRLDAELLLAAALGIERQALLLSDLDREAPTPFEQLVARREKGEPVAYIVGRRGFWTIELEVAPGVLVPRPDSETLIEAAVAHFGSAGSGGPHSILDLGTGSGALLLAALDQWPAARGIGIDRCARALAIARANGERLGLADRAQFRLGDWAEGIAQRFDLILCNPPYVETGADLPRDVVEWEPHEALFAGADGLADYRRIAPEISGLLGQDGIACVEIGLGQAAAVTALFAAAGLRVGEREDLGGRTRCLILTR
jgi:release factor glutamine methyltransferase